MVRPTLAAYTCWLTRTLHGGTNSRRLFLFRGVLSGRLGLLAAGERLRPEDQPRELFGDDLQLVLRAGFVEPVDHRDQRADILLA